MATKKKEKAPPSRRSQKITEVTSGTPKVAEPPLINPLITNPPSLETKPQMFTVSLIPQEEISSVLDLNYNESALNLLILKIEHLKEKYNLQRIAWVRESIKQGEKNKNQQTSSNATAPTADKDIL